MEWPAITLADVREAKRRLCAAPAADPALSVRRAGRAGRRRDLGQAREPPAGRRLQGPRRRQPCLAARRGRAAARPHRRLDWQPRPVGRLRGAPLRRPARVCVPENANPVKLAAMRAHGAELIEHGLDFDAAREHCAGLAEEHGYRYVHSGNEPHLIAGVGTETLEILEAPPDVDAIIVPIGGGSGAAGACVVAKAVRPEIEVIGVQSDAAPAAFRSWQSPLVRRGRDVDVRRGPRHARPVRAAAADPLGAPGRLRPRLRGRDPRGDAADDRAHAQPRRARGRGTARGRAEARATGCAASGSRSSRAAATSAPRSSRLSTPEGR